MAKKSRPKLHYYAPRIITQPNTHSFYPSLQWQVIMLEPIYRFATIYGIVHNFMGMGFRAAISNGGYPLWTHVWAHGLGAQLLPAKIQATMAMQLYCTLHTEYLSKLGLISTVWQRIYACLNKYNKGTVWLDDLVFCIKFCQRRDFGLLTPTKMDCLKPVEGKW